MYEQDTEDLYLNRLAELDLKNPTEPGALNSEKISFAAKTQIFFSMLDTLELCQMVWGPAWTLYGPIETVDLVNAVTGWDIDLVELMEVGERRLNLLCVFNTREGFTRDDDRLPEKFLKSLSGSGPTAGTKLNREEYEAALDLYYSLNGWTIDGIPIKAKLTGLGIEWASEFLTV